MRSTPARASASISGPMPPSGPAPTSASRSASAAEKSGRMRALDVDPVGGDARLPGVAELRDRGLFDRMLEVAVGEDDQRRVSAQLHRRALDAVGGHPQQLAPDRRRAGERELPQPRIGDQGSGQPVPNRSWSGHSTPPAGDRIARASRRRRASPAASALPASGRRCSPRRSPARPCGQPSPAAGSTGRSAGTARPAAEPSTAASRPAAQLGNGRISAARGPRTSA